MINYTVEEHLRYSDLPPVVVRHLYDCNDKLQSLTDEIKRLELREELLLERLGMARELVENILQELRDMDAPQSVRKRIARLIEESCLEW